MKRKFENFEKKFDDAISRSLIKENGKTKFFKGIILTILTFLLFPLFLIYDIIKWIICYFVVLEDEETVEEKKVEK